MMSANGCISVLERYKKTRIGLAIQEYAGVDFDNLTLKGCERLEEVINGFEISLQEIYRLRRYRFVQDKEMKVAVTAYFRD